ncbi:MAG: UDP-N-acetylglucosamine 2-epimerase [archaeon]
MFYHIFIGTKAQYIKTAPLIRLFDQNKIDYRLIDSGQHGKLSVNLRKELNIRLPDVQIGQHQDLDSLGKIFIWTLRIVYQVLFHHQQLNTFLFANKKGYCVLHGDTPTTLISFLLCKLYDHPVIHIEAGLRSFNIFHPFPEELIRLVVMRWADVLFAPSESHQIQARKLNKTAKILNVRMNSGYDEMCWALQNPPDMKLPDSPYGVITIHRFETIFSKQKLSFIIRLVKKITLERRLVFVLHPPTLLRLERNHLYSELEKMNNLTIVQLLSHRDFVHLLKHSEFLISDGGSIQEEAYYLNVPTIIMRKKTERSEGLGKNAVLCGFDSHIIDSFFSNLNQYRHNDIIGDYSPSRKMFDIITHLPK